jgi:GNAT superfamily N-acetyltransferase
MNNKRLQPSIILGLVAIALIIKGFTSGEMAMVAIGILLILLSVSRTMLIKKFSSEEYDDVDAPDMITRYLLEAPVLYVEMLEVYKSGNGEVLYAENDGILLYDNLSFNYLASAKTLAGARDIVRLLPQDYGVFVAHDEIFQELIGIDFVFKDSLLSYNHVYQSSEHLPLENTKAEIRLLDDSYLEVIKQHYTIERLSTDTYILGRIKDGMLGAFVDDKLAGFIGIHDSGPIGLLEVFDEYRGQKLAQTLQAAIMNRLIDQGKTVFLQVNVTNEVSLHIQKKLHMTCAKNPCGWYFS